MMYSETTSQNYSTATILYRNTVRDQTPVNELYAAYTFVPSDQMILRRYRPLNRVRSFFEDGLFLYNLAEFKDPEEGRLVKAEQDAKIEANRPKQKSGIRIDPFAIPSRQKSIREKFFANCMRMGTDEDPAIWKEYVDDDMKSGVALEMTFGNLRDHLPTDTPNEFAGICWYIDRWTDRQPWREAVTNCFIKGKKHAPQREFRLLSRHNSENSDKPDEWDHTNTKGKTPDYRNKPFVFLDINTGDLVDRIILAPRATGKVRGEIKRILDDNDLNIPIVKSQQSGGPELSEAHDSEVRIASQRIDQKPEVGTQRWIDHHDDIVEDWLGNTNFGDLNAVDTITRQWNEYSVQECYKYPESRSNIELSDYVHEYVPYYFNGNRFIDEVCKNHIENDGEEQVREANREE